MNDSDLKDIFAGFNPDLSPSDKFMARLGLELDAVEMIRERSKQQRRISRMALFVTSAVSLVAGFLLSLTVPYLDSLMINLVGYILSDSSPKFSILMDCLPWVIVSAAVVAISLYTYDIALTVIGRRVEIRSVRAE